MTRAACVGHDPKLWFPNKGVHSRLAHEICNSCPVQVDCREYALASGIRHGIWGGADRRALRRTA